jgi:small subunit ribosomal protein S1
MNEAPKEPEETKENNVSQDMKETPQVEQPTEEVAQPEVETEQPVAEEAAAPEAAAPEAVEEVVAAVVAEEAAPEAVEEVVAEVVADVVAEEAAPEAVEKKEPVSEGPRPTEPREISVPTGDFDWDSFESDVDELTIEERTNLENLYEANLTLIEDKQVVTGTVINLGKKEVVVNIGYKSEGIITASEFRYNPDLKPGDKVAVFVEKTEDSNGQLVVSHRTARVYEAWAKINEAKEEDLIINGTVKCRTKGGLIVDVFGLEAFLPGSQVDVKPIRDFDEYVGKEMEFKVVKINQEFKNVVVSHKALIEAELEEQKRLIIKDLEKGQVLEGTVKNVTSYGVFVDLGGVDGLVHITDMSWGRVGHPEELVELDAKINVVILDFDDDKRRIALGMKQLTPHPWDSLTEELTEGTKVQGKVVVMADYGAFIEIAPGVEGLLHVSEMSWSQHLRSAQDFLTVGQEVECVLLSIDREERKMSLGLKQMSVDPWAEIETRYPINSKQKGKVRNFTNFGLFVELEEGIDGLVHISDLSWSKKIKHPSEFCSVGDEIEVVVMELDNENRRMSLGHKQIEENPWEVFETIFAVASKHQATVVKIDGANALIALPYGLEGTCHIKHLNKADGEALEVDATAEFVVLEFNRNAKRITVSHLRTHEEGPAKKERKPRSNSGGSGGSSTMMDSINKKTEKSTLGDLDILSKLKQTMDSSALAPEPEAAPAAKEEAPAAKEEAPAAKEEAPAVEEEAPAAKKPAAKKAAAKKPAAKKPAAKKPAAKKPAAKKPAAKKAAAKKPAAKKPAAKKAADKK